jgi:predicted nucleotidyltransferase
MVDSQYFRIRRGLEHLKEPYRSLVARLLHGLLKVFNDRLVSVVVFGSVARGDARRDSDIDLIIVVEELPKSRFKRLELFEKAEEDAERLLEEFRGKGFNTDFSPILLTVEEARKHRPIYLDVLVDGVIIYDRNRFMESVLREVAEKLRALGAARIRVGKRWYWVLKKDYKPGEVIEV